MFPAYPMNSESRPLHAVALRLAGLSAAALAAFAVPAFAQTANPAPTTQEEVYTLSTFQVTTTADRGYRAGNSVSATRIDTPIKDLPFSISAFTEQFIEDIGALELVDIVSYAPGVTSGAKEFTQGNNRYSIRGFDGDVTPQRNGFVGARYVDAGNISRVEVVKGPASLLYGQITPGGSVNYITKRAHNRDQVRLKGQIGTDDFWRAEFDVNRSLADGKFNARIIGAYEHLMAWANPSGGHSELIAGSFEIRPTSNVSLFLEFEVYDRNQRPLVGMKPNISVAGFTSASAGNYPDPLERARAQAYVDVGNLNLGFLGYPPLAMDFNYVGAGDYRNSTFDSINAELNVKFNENWRGRANIGWNDFKISNKLTGLAEFTATPAAGVSRFAYRDMLRADPHGTLMDPTKTASAILTRRKRLEESMGDSYSYQAELAGKMELGGVTLKPLFGAFLTEIGSGSFRRESNTLPGATPNAQTAPNQHFQPWQYNNPATWVNTDDYNVDLIPNVNSFNDAEGEDSAYYAVLTAQLFNDRLILIGGARYNETWTVNTDMRPTLAGNPPSVGSKFEATKTTPQFGAGFKLRPDVLLFASYSESFFIEDRSLTSINPNYNIGQATGPGNQPTISTPAQPTTGEGYEFGIKTDLMDGRVSSTISWFHLERQNRVLRFRETVPTFEGQAFPTITRQGTVDQSEGFEFEVTWSPTDNWQVYASLTLMDIKTVKGTFPPIIAYSADPAVQAAYVAAYNEARDLILNAVPEGSAETLATLWTRYNFPSDTLKGWWIAGGFVHTGEKAQRTANPTLFLKESTIFDATLGYDWRSNGQEWSATLAWKNIADEEYFLANQARGQPGRLIFTLSTKF